MENKNTRLKIIIAILCVLVLLLSSYIIYDKLLKTDVNRNDNKDNEVIQNNNINKDENNELDINENNNQDGKIYIKRNVVINLEEVPSDITGKYVNKDVEEDYFILNTDGTAIVNFPSGDRGTVVNKDDISFQLTYLTQGSTTYLILEFYTNSGGIYSPIRIGSSTFRDSYQFTVTEGTPSANAGTTIYERVDN